MTWELCTGAINNTAYVNETRIFETQQSLALHDVTSSNTFINFFDHGYHVLLDAQQHGGQLCVRPVFSRHNRKFNTMKVLYLAAVATVRSGNERAVKQVKISWLIKRGCTFQNSCSFDMLADIWICWGFQVNFLYNAVH